MESSEIIDRSHSLATDLVLYYQFDEGAGTTINDISDSANTHNATATVDGVASDNWVTIGGNLYWQSAGGEVEYLTVPHHSDFGIPDGQNFSVGMFFYWDGGTFDRWHFFNKGGQFAGGWNWQTQDWNDEWEYDITDQEMNVTLPEYSGALHQMVVTYDQSTGSAEVYVDGTNVASLSWDTSTGSTSNTLDLVIADDATGAPRQAFHRVGIWNRVLTAQEALDWWNDKDLMLASGVATTSGTGSISSTGSLSGTGFTTLSGTGSISGIDSLDANGYSALIGTGSISSTGSLDGVGVALLKGSGSIGSTSTLSGTGESPIVPDNEGVGNISSSASLSATGLSPSAINAGTGSISTSSVLSGTGYTTFSGTGSINGLSSLDGEGTAKASGVGQIDESGSLGASGESQFTGSGSISGVAEAGGIGEITYIGTGQITVMNVLEGTGSNITQIPKGVGGLSVTSNLTGYGTTPDVYAISGKVTLNGSSVGGAVVTVIDSESHQTVGKEITGNNGKYKILDLDQNKQYHIVVIYKADTGKEYGSLVDPYKTPKVHS